MKTHYIISDADILGGKPIFVNTRISVAMIIEHLANGWTPDQLLAEFPTLKTEYISEALKFSSYLVANEQVIYA